MIQFSNISKSYSTQVVLDDVSFAIHSGERVGIVGPNGAGKSTLFEILTGHISPDKGEFSYSSSLRLGYVRQQLHPYSEENNLIQYVENAIPEIKILQERIVALEQSLSKLAGDELNSALRRLGDMQTEVEHSGAYEIRNKAEATLSGLGFAEKRFKEPFASFSGGWQTRAELARVLVAEPEILLLDEPSNYLDVPAVEWLQNFLRNYKGTLLLISHDRFLLNNLTEITLEVMGAQVTRYKGNYQQYCIEKESRHENLIARKRNIDRKKEQLERFIDRFKSKASKATQAQSKQKQLDKLENLQIRSIKVKAPKINLPAPPRSGQEVLKIEELSFAYKEKANIFNKIDLRLERGERAALIGLNGMGKTTLLRLIAGRIQAQNGRVILGHGVHLGYQAQDYSETMQPEHSVYETVKRRAGTSTEAEVRNFLGAFGFQGEEIEKPVQVLSGGEKVRLGLARLLVQPLNFLLLDEPTTHLDIYAREALQDALQDYQGSICLVSHDIEFVKAVATTIFHLNEDGITRYYGGYNYFREKLAEEQMQKLAEQENENNNAKEQIVTEARKSGNLSAAERRQRKREESMIRNEMSKLRKPQEEIIKKSETALENLEEEQAQIYEKLSNGEAGIDFETLNKRLSEINEEIDAQTTKWMKASEKLEKLQIEYEKRISENQ